jgi:trehalose 6-phosphate synthase
VTDLAPADFEEYYNGFANRVLWPILHYRLDMAEFSRRDLSGYMRVNEHFADQLAAVLKTDDIVWVHDYHLIPLAKALRARGLSNRIGFFLHIPMPPPEIITAMPHHETLIPALCHYDLVGFQTDGDAANFARYLAGELGTPSHISRRLGTGERVMRIGTFPVGIETREFNRLARRAVRTELVRDVAKSVPGRLMIGVDRLDYSKGITLRLEAYERFLAAHPEWHGKITYLQITPKSRSAIKEYADMAQTVNAMAGRINGAFATAAWGPMRYVNQTDPGVLILSRFTGAAVEFKEGALLVNPYDPDSVAAAMARAIAMPQDERRRRHATLYAALLANDISTWGDRFLASLMGTGSFDLRPAGKRPSRDVISPLAH